MTKSPITLTGHHTQTGINIDWEEVVPFAPRPSSAPSLRDTMPVIEGRHLAAVATVMKELDFDRNTAERFIEVEQMYTGIGLPKGGHHG